MTRADNLFSLEDKQKDTVVLIGPNGSGKSQSIFYMALDLKNKNIPFAKYAASREDSVRNANNFSNEDYAYSIVQSFKSEGERMVASFSLWFKNTGLPKLLESINEGHTEFWLFIDELDSGLSYDRISMELNELINIQQLEKKNGRTLHLVFTANSYEFIHAMKKRSDSQIWLVSSSQDVSDSINNFDDFIDLYYEKYAELNES